MWQLQGGATSDANRGAYPKQTTERNYASITPRGEYLTRLTYAFSKKSDNPKAPPARITTIAGFTGRSGLRQRSPTVIGNAMPQSVPPEFSEGGLWADKECSPVCSC